MWMGEVGNVLKFWFEELQPEDWFAVKAELDELIKQRFGSLRDAALRGELYEWRKSPKGRLAEIILLDQFSRNIYRGMPEAFAADSLALCLAQEIVLQKLDVNFNSQEKNFAYMPYMHSESYLIQEKAIELFSAPDLEEGLRYAIMHKDIIERFGRYPHRNKILGRSSTPEEIEFLKTHSGF